mmetsp:Transcript_40717/g.65448  ORF Transcript_40717/g.65448 Transcript_40717/m.65448 type:complete len:638 (+) Transcript_40717:1195-3108(+)
MAPSNSRRGSRRATFQDEPMFELLRQKYSIDRKYSTQSLKIKKKLERLEPTPTNRLRPSASESDLQKGVTITLKSLKRTGHSPRRGTRGSDAPYKEGKVSIADSKNERKQPQRIVGRGSHGISSATSPTRASRGISGATSPTRASRFFSGATSPSPIHLQRAMSTVTPLQLKRSMSHEEGKDHWNPERGMAVTIRGANPSSHLLLEDPYKGTIGHMINQRFWWVSDEKGRFKVIPLAKIRPRLDGHDSWFFQRRVTALANAKAVFDRHDEEKRRLQQQQLVDAIDQILKISLEIEEARTQFLAIMTDEEEKNAVLLYVNILTFKKTFGGRNFRSNHELGVPEIGGYETDNSADMRMRALEIYKGFIQENAPLSCAEFIAEETASKLRSILQNKQKKLRDTVFDDCAEDCLQFIEQTTWTELKKLWIILIQLWRKAFTRPGLETMDSRVKVLRNYMPKPFMRFYGSPAMCLIRDTHASEIPQWRSKTNKGVESGTNPMRRGGTMKNSEEKEHVMCTWGDRINERALFKEGFLRKKFLTRGGYAKRYVRIVLEEDVEEGSSALPRVMFCYYNTSDDEDAGLKADLKMPIDEHFSVTRSQDDPRNFTVTSSNYEKEHHSVNAMVELSSNGLTLRAKSPGR